MLERYFVRPATVDRIRASWIGVPIEQYVTSLADKGYAARNVFRRVPVLVWFGEARHPRIHGPAARPVGPRSVRGAGGRILPQHFLDVDHG